MEQIVETDERGALTLPPELLGDVRPHTRYIVASHGKQLVIMPAIQPRLETNLTRRKTKLTPEQWRTEWEEWSAEVTKAWSSRQNAAEILAEMRR